MSPRRTTTSPATCATSVAQWRRDRLIAAGFAPGPAAALARDAAIDLHAVLGLVDRGCPPALAVRILAPLEGPAEAPRDRQRRSR